MIDGVVIKDLVVHQDERGWVMEMLRADDPQFREFGQTYVTTTYEGVVKAWHMHRKQTDNVCCILGTVKLVLYDSRPTVDNSAGEVMEIYMGGRAPKLVTIPPMVRHGWKSVDGTAVILNCTDYPYNYTAPDEDRFPAHGYRHHYSMEPYNWDRIDR